MFHGNGQKDAKNILSFLCNSLNGKSILTTCNSDRETRLIVDALPMGSGAVLVQILILNLFHMPVVL